MTSVHFICASTSGNTEHVATVLSEYLSQKDPSLEIEKQRAEQAKPEDLLRGDVLILGSGTWNTGGQEGQLNTHMHALLHDRSAHIDLQGKQMSFISLGDDRYYFRTRCTEHFLRFQREHHGKLLVPPLIIVNEPYEQTERIQKWADRFLHTLQSLPKA